MKEKRVRLAGTEVAIRMDDRQAERITRTWPYRRAVGPALRRLGLAGNGRHAAPAIPVYLARPVAFPDATPEQRAIVERIKDHGWYHTIELGHGVRTPGLFDHGPALAHFPLPASLAGKRCLDVATLDGYWAFEMERRGAAEVLALDIATWTDLDVPPQVRAGLVHDGKAGPTGRGFAIAAELLGSRVQRRICNVYDLTPERFGTFDFVFCSDLLIHLGSPIRAMQNVFSVTRGEAVFVEAYLPELEATGLASLAQLRGAMEDIRWWDFSRDFLDKAVRLAGFTEVEFCDPVDVRLRGAEHSPSPRAIIRARPGPARQAEAASAVTGSTR